jgi:translocation and assembly module TamA
MRSLLPASTLCAIGAMCGLVLCAPAWAKPAIAIDSADLPANVVQAVSQAVNSIAALADDQDGGEDTRLRRRAQDASVTALATEGYFAPQVTLLAGGDAGNRTWNIAIQPGPRALVVAVDLQFVGAITGPSFDDRIATLKENWTLKQDMPFQNDQWETAKRNLLDGVSARDFPAAHLVETAADVDADHARVNLHIKLDSGPAVRLSGVQVKGLKRVPKGVVERYVRIVPGEPYDRKRLIDWQQQLQGTPFFSGAKLELDESTISPGQGKSTLLPDVAVQQQTQTQDEYQGPPLVTLPVLADVTESRPRRMSLAAGVDNEAGPRVESIYRQNVVMGQPVELETGLRLDDLRQLAYADIHLAPDPAGHSDSFGVLAQHSDIQGLEVRRLAVGAIRVYTRKPTDPTQRAEYETRLGSRLANEHDTIEGLESYTTNTATGTVEWLRRDVNDKYDPREGNLIDLGAGLGTEVGGSNRFGRLSARGQYWWSLSPRDVLTVRGEIGKLWARDILRVPDDFAFRTGGARSVRGYSYLGLGRHVGDAILGDATLLVASIEGTHYFNDRYGAALFVDTGNVAPSFGSMKLATGVGTGVRIKTPAGPLAVDIAYALLDKSVRLNFSLGIAF